MILVDTSVLIDYLPERENALGPNLMKESFTRRDVIKR
jgi:hypothetical protein